MVRHAGFVEVELGEMVDVFSGSPHESDAKEFLTRGVTFAARKPIDERADRRTEQAPASHRPASGFAVKRDA
ncbi:MAG: hypothetical protein ACRDJE_22260 [Dehalococcoidia bacterium]